MALPIRQMGHAHTLFSHLSPLAYERNERKRLQGGCETFLHGGDTLYSSFKSAVRKVFYAEEKVSSNKPPCDKGYSSIGRLSCICVIPAITNWPNVLLSTPYA